MMSMSFHLGYTTGPSVGGFLVDAVGWRLIFFMNLPVGYRGGVNGLESVAGIGDRKAIIPSIPPA